MITRPILLLLFAGATFSLLMSLWDAWHGRIRTESGFISNETKDKAPSLSNKLIALQLVGPLVVFIIVAALLLWLW